jgi:hydrogenase maturation protein HypF
MTELVLVESCAALNVRVTGIVQGVGFRPFVHRLATRHALRGWVRNDADGVEISIEGAPAGLDAFVRALSAEAPPLARVDTVAVHAREPDGIEWFRIISSADVTDHRQAVAPDVAMCEDCERELYDPANRRFQYPFVTCTNCGPRYSVIERMPYDRERTSMRAFTQCATCLEEYLTPGDRRHHSETNSCPRCGPRLELLMPGAEYRDFTALEKASRLLRRGAIVALRGLGGFHLVVDATNDEAVARLRRRKHREAKPFAVMVRTIDEAGAIAVLDPDESALLNARERPVVVVPRRSPGPLSSLVAPGMTTVGLMLAYTPLHHLLLDLAQRPLVMTSGNASDEPLCAGVDESLRRLRGIADAFLVHDREIVARVDDSVMRVARSRPLFLRRARGFAPLPVPLPVSTPLPIVGMGAHLKNTVTLAQDGAAYVSPHIGDLETLETLEHFRATVERIARLHRIEPQVVAHDLHPGYLSTAEALRMDGVRRVAVQHHHAHIAAVCAEHGITDPVLGVAFDGTGFGDDGTVWGAEFLVADLVEYQRVGHLRAAPLPGSARAVRTPWRAALGYLSLEPSAAAAFRHAFDDVDPSELEVARRQAERGINAPLASSMGRLFDAAAAILGVRREVQFEGQAAMELEALAGRRVATPLPFPIVDGGADGLVLDPLPLLAALSQRRERGTPVEELAAAFHESVAATTSLVVQRLAAAHRLGIVALGGGSFQNARLLESLSARLEVAGWRVVVPRALPPNDGAISYGQVAIAAARLSQERT